MKQTKQKNKLRVSYSLLTFWEKGMYEDCISLYLHKDTLKNEAVENGKRLHKKWEEEIKKTNKLKIGKTEISFSKPQTELKFYVPYNEIADLSVVIDCLDTPFLYEWKSGTTSSTQYGSSYQVPLYFLACQLRGIEVKTAILLRYNQEKDEEDATVIHNGEKTISRVRNYIDTFLPEIYDFFKSRGII